MKTKIVERLFLVFLVLSIFSLGINVRIGKANPAIIINPDGSIDPPTAPIQRDGDIYVFASDIYDSIIVQRSNIIIDGADYTLQGAGAGRGMDLWGLLNVTIRNTRITSFSSGIFLESSAYVTITGNNISGNTNGVETLLSHSNAIIGNMISANSKGVIIQQSYLGDIISGNNIIQNSWGIDVTASSGEEISQNNITSNYYGVICEQQSSNHVISENTLSGNAYGIFLVDDGNSRITGNKVTESSNCGISLGMWTSEIITGNIIANNQLGIWVDDFTHNTFYHNNAINNVEQVDYYWLMSASNIWDNGYPSGGNFWSDYTGVDLYNGPGQNLTGSDGIGDTPYTIDGAFQDNYPFMTPYNTTNFLALRITATAGGTTSPVPGPYVYKSGTVVNISAIAETNYLFDHWELDSVNVGAANPFSVTMDTNHALHAIFTAKPTLTITATTGGTTDPSPGSYVCEPGSLVPVTAIPQADCLLDYWALDGINIGSANPVSLIMDANHALHAVFKPRPDIAVTSVMPYPTSVRRGQPVYIDVTVVNQRFTSETFDIVVYADRDRNIIGDEIIVGVQTVFLSPGSTKTTAFVWDTSTLPSGTGYYISAKAIVPYDIDPSNNLLTAKKKVNVRQ